MKLVSSCGNIDIIPVCEYNNNTEQRCPKENMVRPPLAAIQNERLDKYRSPTVGGNTNERLENVW